MDISMCGQCKEKDSGGLTILGTGHAGQEANGGDDDARMHVDDVSRW